MKELKNVIHYYLPHGVECEDHNGGGITLTTLKLLYFQRSQIDIKPLLRDLSDLTKEMAEWLFETKREDFNADYYSCVSWYEMQIQDIDNMPFDMAQKILSLHGDLFGLIESNQAIKK